MKVWLASLLLIPSLALAEDEAHVACDLARAQAEVQASVLSMPAAFASFGDPAVNEKIVAVGVSESLSGLVRAKRLRDAAQASCDSAGSSMQLDRYVHWSMIAVQKRGAAAALGGLNDAIDLAKQNVTILNQQLATNATDVAAVGAAVNDLRSLEDHKSPLLKILTTVVPAISPSDVAGLLTSYQSDQGRAAQLTALSNANSGWDVAIRVGGQKPISNIPPGSDGSATPFVTASIRYSFGTHAAREAATQVGRDTELLIATAELGYPQVVGRLREEVRKLLEIENSYVGGDLLTIDTLQRMRAPLAGIESVLATNALRTVDIRLKAARAELAGSRERSVAFTALLAELH
jgi:hypothetical protein